jgi:hypothetical protein
LRKEETQEKDRSGRGRNLGDRGYETEEVIQSEIQNWEEPVREKQ